MKSTKKLTSLFLALVLVFLSSFTSAYAENELFRSFNIMNYATERYGTLVSSQLHYTGSELIRAEIEDNIVHIEVFDNNYNLKRTYTVNGELEYVCGVHFGENYNFIVCAQTNPNEDDSREVVRTVKYTKDWEKIKSASIYGANTYIFEDAGSLRFAEYKNHLYIRTCHEMYISADGKHHQANMTFVIDTDTMTITDNDYKVSNNSEGYVSHSFNQFIAVDNETGSVVAVDHGDALPRSIIMFRYDNQLGSETLGHPTSVNLFNIAGNSGDNTTGVSVSELLVTDNNYIVAFNSSAQNGISVVRNVYLAIVPKNSFKNESVKIVKLTDYKNTDSVVCGYPYVTDIGNGQYSVIWEAHKPTDTKNYTYYTTVDENGNMLSGINSFEAYLSNCEPIYVNGKTIWYSTFNSEPVFFYINKSSAGIECDKYEDFSDKFVDASWEHEEYFTDDEKVFLILNPDTNSSITSIKADSDTNKISYGYKGNKFSITTYSKPGTYYFYATFANGKILKKSIVVKDEKEKTTLSPDNSEHSYRTQTIQKQNCLTDGIIEYTCNYCGHSYREIIPATGHKDADDDGLCDNCRIILLTENPTAYIKWEKSEYYTDENSATFNVICDEGVRITTIYSSASSYTYKVNSKTSITYYYYGTPGTTKVYVKLSDGQIIGTELVVKDRNAPSSEATTVPETTTKPITENTTVPPVENETTTQPPTVTNIKGDVNNDALVTAEDARLVLRISAQLDLPPANILIVADTDDNKQITAADARTILRVSAQLETFD